MNAPKCADCGGPVHTDYPNFPGPYCCATCSKKRFDAATTLFCECGHEDICHWRKATIGGELWPCAECACTDWVTHIEDEENDENQTAQMAAELTRGPWPK